MDAISKPVIPYMIQKRVNLLWSFFKRERRNVVENNSQNYYVRAQQIIQLHMGMIESLSTAIEFRSGESGTSCSAYP